MVMQIMQMFSVSMLRYYITPFYVARLLTWTEVEFMYLGLVKQALGLPQGTPRTEMQLMLPTDVENFKKSLDMTAGKIRARLVNLQFHLRNPDTKRMEKNFDPNEEVTDPRNGQKTTKGEIYQRKFGAMREPKSVIDIIGVDNWDEAMKQYQ